MRIIKEVSAVRQNRRERAPIVLSRLESTVYITGISDIGEECRPARPTFCVVPGKDGKFRSRSDDPLGFALPRPLIEYRGLIR